MRDREDHVSSWVLPDVTVWGLTLISRRARAETE